MGYGWNGARRNRRFPARVTEGGSSWGRAALGVDTPSSSNGGSEVEPCAPAGSRPTAAIWFSSAPVRLNQHFPQSGSSWTLNALDWMGYGEIPEMGGLGVVYAYDEDRKIIEWFNSEVGGSPVIAEVSIDQYRCGGTRISVHTGLPVVVGWVWHESQQRDWVDLQERQNDLRTLYTTTDPQEKLELLETYRIEYVVVGELEQSYPSNGCESTDNLAGIAAFEPLVGSALEVAFTAGDSIVYRVIAP